MDQWRKSVISHEEIDEVHLWMREGREGGGKEEGGETKGEEGWITFRLEGWE